MTNISSIKKDFDQMKIQKDTRSPSCLTHAPLTHDRPITDIRSQYLKEQNTNPHKTRFAFVDDSFDEIQQ